RREPGQHEKGHQRRQQRERNGRKAERPWEPSRRGRRGSGRQLGGGGLTDVSHQDFSYQTAARNGATKPPAWAPPQIIDGIFPCCFYTTMLLDCDKSGAWPTGLWPFGTKPVENPQSR